MAIAKVADRGSVQNLTGQGATTVNVTGTVSVGNVLIARIAVDNSGGGGAAPGLSVSGSAGNTWNVVGPALIDPGAASAGMVAYLCYAVITTQITASDTISFDWTGTPAAKAIVLEEWSGIDTAAPVAVAGVTASGSTGSPSVSISPTAAGQLVYAMIAIEGSSGDTYVVDSDTTNGSWVTLTNLSTTSGTATSNATVRGQYKIVTASGAQTWNPTILLRDWAAIGIVFAAGIPVTAKTATDTLSISITGTAQKDALGEVARENFEDTTYDLIFSTPNDWIRTSAQAHAGTWSWTNADIADSQTSDSVILVPEGATSVQFWYMVSSESGWDYFRFLIAGVQQFQASGTVAWTQSASYTVSAGQALTFRYFKDGSQSVGADSAYVDDIVFTGVAGPPPIAKPTSDTLSVSLSGTAVVDNAIEQLIYPDAALTQTLLTGAVTDIDEDPNSPDANWMTGGGAVVLRVSFPSPDTNLVTTINQNFKVRVRPGT